MELGKLVGDKTVLESTNLHTKNFGTVDSGKLVLSSEETLFLIEKKKIDIGLSFTNTLNKLSKKQRNITERFSVYRDMRSKGYILKSGLKFGCDFRVYEKKKDHAKWLLFVTKDSAKLQWKTFSGMARVANSTKKDMLNQMKNVRDIPTSASDSNNQGKTQDANGMLFDDILGLDGDVDNLFG